MRQLCIQAISLPLIVMVVIAFLASFSIIIAVVIMSFSLKKLGTQPKLIAQLSNLERLPTVHMTSAMKKNDEKR